VTLGAELRERGIGLDVIAQGTGRIDPAYHPASSWHGSNGAISAVRSGNRVRWSPRRQSVYLLELAGLLAALPLMP
jgi:hypothetical protein